MKFALIVLTVLSTSAALAASDGKLTTGVSEILEASGGSNTIVIKGAAAQRLMDLMSDDLLQTEDAGNAPGGLRVWWKNGKDIACTASSKMLTQCSIRVNDVKSGAINK